MTPTDWDGWICLMVKAGAVALCLGLDVWLLVELGSYVEWLSKRRKDGRK